ncbi:MAG: cobyrinate a,c-diamide synthase [Gammaproteobacteria bacterium]|nr:cobyrinate a,c-diamide synthase [Gammaproteobacteria bacterium]
MASLFFSAPHKSSGKTTLVQGIAAALKKRGLSVQPFKKGPDYIDPMWLARAAGRPCYNLDFHTMGDTELLYDFNRYRANSDIALIEGNMGLFDSLDVAGSQSNAEMAKLLGSPVILIVDVAGATRSIAPLILGFSHFDSKLNIAGIILNRVAGVRHEQRLREVMQRYIPIPLLGVLHRHPDLHIEERHLGLIPSNEAVGVEEKLQQISQRIEAQVNLDALLRLACQQSVAVAPTATPCPMPATPGRLRIAIARDEAFGFYYASDLERLCEQGATLIPFSPIHDHALPEAIDGLILGGGFPETALLPLSANLAMREAIGSAIDHGLPTYAECGGLIYLCRQLTWMEKTRPLAGVIAADVVMEAKPVGRGYAVVNETSDFPWPLAEGCALAQATTSDVAPPEFAAHEFHYSHLKQSPEELKAAMGDSIRFAYHLQRGTGLGGQCDGIVYKNLFASYIHLRDSASNRWTSRFIAFIRQQQNSFRKELYPKSLEMMEGGKVANPHELSKPK